MKSLATALALCFALTGGAIAEDVDRYAECVGYEAVEGEEGGAASGQDLYVTSEDCPPVEEDTVVMDDQSDSEFWAEMGELMEDD